MCDNCGCNITQGNKHLLQPGSKHSKTESGNDAVTVLANLLHENDHCAKHNRDHFDNHAVLAINLMSSPGAGKTSLLESTIQALQAEGNTVAIAVIEGDLETENDAKRIRQHGIPAIQITTGSACHLDAHMIHQALHEIDLHGLDIIFIENVGNLVCPAGFDLGQHHNVVLLSVPEGDDKPAKYPVMFRAADLVLISKSDLLPVLDDFKPENAIRYMHDIASPAPIFELSARTGAGMEQWLGWLHENLAQQKSTAPTPHAEHSHHQHHASDDIR